MKSLALIAVTSVDTAAHCAALMHSKREIEKKRSVEDMLIISWEDPPKWYTGRTLKLPFKIDIMTYGRFQVRKLAQYMTTEYMLNIQADGFVTNGELWEEDFLEFDYIGAPWAKPQMDGKDSWPLCGARVGNSGFSIRSKQWMDRSAMSWDGVSYADRTEAYEPYDDQGDDIWWTQVNQRWMEDVENPIKRLYIAPLSLAARFSVEQDIPEYPDRTPQNTFGQHARAKFQV